jgi:alpha-tubulin suppressor-like RCC1 family protein
MRAVLAFATAASALAGCSLLTDLSGFSGGSDAPCDGGACADGEAPPQGSEGGVDSGTDAAVDAPCVPPPPKADHLSDALALALGDGHSCALRAGGTVVCWGENGDGQLGAGGGADTSVPVTIPGITGARAIAAGTTFACAIDASRQVICWGANDYGQIGLGTTDATAHLPTKVHGAGGAPVLDQVDAIAAGPDHACAIRLGAVICWGGNGGSQLGHAGADPSPSVIAGLSNAIAISAGNDYACATVDQGGGTYAAFCWGNDDEKQLANANGDQPVPVKIPLALAAPDGRAVLSAGWGHVCARDKDNALWCWGEDDFGQLGAGVSPGADYSALQKMNIGAGGAPGCGDDFTCVVQLDGSVRCIGVNGAGEHGIGIVDPLVGDSGVSAPRTTFSSAATLPPVASVVARAHHACAILPEACPGSGGEVMCWGSNDDGEIGDGTSASNVPTPSYVRAP